MRRLAALLLVLASGWMLFQTADNFILTGGSRISADMLRVVANPNVYLPLAGGTLGLLGGLIVFFGGPGGAAIALVGGLIAAGFALSLKTTFHNMAIWENDQVVGATMLVLAGVCALLGRN